MCVQYKPGAARGLSKGERGRDFFRQSAIHLLSVRCRARSASSRKSGSMPSTRISTELTSGSVHIVAMMERAASVSSAALVQPSRNYLVRSTTQVPPSMRSDRSFVPAGMQLLTPFLP